MSETLPPLLDCALAAVRSKKANDLLVLDLRKVASFADFFLIASGSNQRQLVAMADAVDEALRAEGWRPKHREGYPRREWILLDYGDVLIHIFTPEVREFYDLERLWGGAARIEVDG